LTSCILSLGVRSRIFGMEWLEHFVMVH
jgi:hypothetical protein